MKKETLDKMMPNPKKPLDFGLGIMAVPFYNQVSFGHGGDTAGSHAITSYNTKEDYSVSMIINGEEYHHNEFGAGILSMIYDADYTYPKFGNDVTPEKFKNYIGDYSSPDIPIDLKIFSQEGKLFAQGKGQASFELEYVDKDEFKFAPAKIQVIFFPNQLQLLQNGKTYNYTKK